MINRRKIIAMLIATTITGFLLGYMVGIIISIDKVEARYVDYLWRSTKDDARPEIGQLCIAVDYVGYRYYLSSWRFHFVKYWDVSCLGIGQDGWVTRGSSPTAYSFKRFKYWAPIWRL